VCAVLPIPLPLPNARLNIAGWYFSTTFVLDMPALVYSLWKRWFFYLLLLITYLDNGIQLVWGWDGEVGMNAMRMTCHHMRKQGRHRTAARWDVWLTGCYT
jgi:hypothetical protein